MAAKPKLTAVGIALGVALGGVVGVMAGHLAIWLALGVAIGVVIGASYPRKGIDCPECAAVHRQHISGELQARRRT